MIAFTSLLFQKHFQFLKLMGSMVIIVAIMIITHQMKINYKQIILKNFLPKRTHLIVCLKSILIRLNINKGLSTLILDSKHISLRYIISYCLFLYQQILNLIRGFLLPI